MTRPTFVHGALIVDNATLHDFSWIVFSLHEREMADEWLEGEAGPRPVDYAHMIAMLGDRGWEMFQVLPQEGKTVHWFRSRLDT